MGQLPPGTSLSTTSNRGPILTILILPILKSRSWRTAIWCSFSLPSVARVSLEYPLALEEIVLKHDTREIRARLRGDEVVGMENFGTDLTYFDPLE